MRQRWASLNRRILIGLVLGLFVTMMGQSLVRAHAMRPNSQPARVASPAVGLVVSPEGPYRTIQEALADAQPGETISVQPGVYAGPVIVDKQVILEGVGKPVVDGGGQGTVITLAAAGSVLRGFEVRGSGSEPDRDHAGITITAADVLVEDNTLDDVLFGIFVAQADRAVLRRNEITSKSVYEQARKGDGIRLWYSKEVTVEENIVRKVRDVVIWYSENVVVRDNRIEDGRYGIHLMYCDGALISGNRLAANSVGIYTMYSKDVSLLNNDIRQQRGPSGSALGFKDADNVEAQGNLLVDNRVGILLDGTPYSPKGYAHFHNNILAYNDIGVVLLTAVRGAEFQRNTFWENIEQMSIQGNGKTGENMWLGNVWSDYTGFDADGDGVGDLAYQSDRFFENLTDREPLLRALIYSPAAQAIEFAVASFPIFKPQPKFNDPAPGMKPAEIPAGALPASGTQTELYALGLGLIAISALLVGMAMNKRDIIEKNRGRNSTPANEETPVIVSVEDVVKKYGKITALAGVSFQVQRGEALALWGSNGAGKTTLMKALLGLVNYQGQILVAGQDTLRRGKAARRSIGYVPQEAIYYDMSVLATLHFYARLKKVNRDQIPELLEKLGLSAHAKKAVPALSGGLKQRLALAIALLGDPPLLLLDEPTANLDAKTRREHLALLGRLRKEGKTILFASHRFDEVDSLADRVILLDQGRVVEELPAKSLHQRYGAQFELVLWIASDLRRRAVETLEKEGLQVHENGSGTVVVELGAGAKVGILEMLEKQDIPVLDFQVELPAQEMRAQWN
jgi:nitrous oxidase accessory protein